MVLLPFFECGEHSYSHTVLQFGNVSSIPELLYRLEELTKKAMKNNQFVPKMFGTYLSLDSEGNSCYGDTTKDRYGKPLIYVFVEDLLKLEKIHSEFHRGNNSFDERALATMSYLKKLPKNRRVALYWD